MAKQVNLPPAPKYEIHIISNITFVSSLCQRQNIFSFFNIPPRQYSKVFDGYRLIHISCNIFQNIGELLNVVALSDTGSVMLNMGEKNRMGEENKFHQL